MSNRSRLCLLWVLAGALSISPTCISHSAVQGKQFNKTGVVYDGHKSEINLMFIAWADQTGYAEHIRARFRQAGYSIDPGAPLLLEVILEERRSTNGLWKLLNFFATAASGTAVPYYNQVNYRLRFRRLHRGILLDSCGYDLRNNEFFSLFLLPVAPFFWSTNVLRERFVAATDAFIADCATMKN